MNHNTSVDNDLQKAIEDITKSTNDDPLFADPVAAPAPVGPFPIATPGPMPPAQQAPMPPKHPAPIPPASMPLPKPVEPAEPVSAPAEDIEPAPIEHKEDEKKAPFLEQDNLNISEVREAALRKLAPILSKLDVPAEQKFDIYKTVIDNYHDSSVIESAYRAAADISDDRERGEALLYIIDSIDKM